jgi:hypothetical protein
VRSRTLATADFRKGLPRLMTWLERAEAISRPRLAFLFAPLGERFMGLVCALLALVLILPIPLGNILPAASVSVLGLALVQRDGVLAIAGYALAAASAGVLILAADLVGRMAMQIISFLSAA